MTSSAADRVLHVGVTGHRVFDDPDGVAERVSAGLCRLLALAGDGTAGAHVRLEAITPLAEGADRFVARQILAVAGATLFAALPFAADDYEADFATPQSRREFRDLLAEARAVEVMPPVATRDAGYAQVGRWVVERCDVLVAVWDGRPARGLGGTADIVAHAADRAVPLLWVPATRS